MLIVEINASKSSLDSKITPVIVYIDGYFQLFPFSSLNAIISENIVLELECTTFKAAT
jgi:hypothetical protein